MLADKLLQAFPSTRVYTGVSSNLGHHSSYPAVDRPVVLAGSGRCGSTLVQSILNTNSDFLIWGEHNGFLRQIAAAYYGANHPYFPDKSNLDAAERIKRLRDPRHWPAWDNLCGHVAFLETFRTFVRSLFADPTRQALRWGFKEIRYGHDAEDQTLKFLFECFPETCLLILVRLPEPTIFSMLSRWAFGDRRKGDIDPQEIDQHILLAAESWNSRYSHLAAAFHIYELQCRILRYEDLQNHETYRGLAEFLETDSFDFARCLRRVRDVSNKTDATARLIRQRMELLAPKVAAVTSQARALYYAGGVAA